MKLNEKQIIHLSNKYLSNKKDNIIKGIGDDTAVFTVNNQRQLFTTDMLIEGIHFLKEKILPYDLGWKSLAVSISDIASMGGKPTQALLSLGVNDNYSFEWLEEFFRGLKDCADKYGANVIGGDTVKSPKSLVVNIALLGEAEKPIYRDNITDEYSLYCTGSLGNSALGLEILLSDRDIFNKDELVFIKNHTKPIPRVNEGIYLAENCTNISMMDCSDGLYQSCETITNLSNIGVVIESSQIPFSKKFINLAKQYGKSNLDLSLYGGEDYELIVCLKQSDYKLIREEFFSKFDLSLNYLGYFTSDFSGVNINFENEVNRLSKKGFSHF